MAKNFDIHDRIRTLKELSGEMRYLVKSRLWLKVIIGMVLGILVGFAMGPSVGWVDLSLTIKEEGQYCIQTTTLSLSESLPCIRQLQLQLLYHPK